MGSYEIRWKKSAERDLRKIDPQHIPRILKEVESLSSDPFPSQFRKLRGSEREYRIRVGDYRVIYEVDSKAELVVVIHIRHRREAYR